MRRETEPQALASGVCAATRIVAESEGSDHFEVSTVQEISHASLVGSAHLSSYLATLPELRLVERRLPATTPSAQRRISRQGRYHLSDPYFRFYFRFLAPMHDALAAEPDQVLAAVKGGLRAFVGQTAFEQLAQEWVLWAGRSGGLGWQPGAAGSHWSRRVQVDVVAVDWTSHNLLLGECKWTGDAVGREIVRDLLENKTPKVLADMDVQNKGWTVQHAVFTRSGFDAEARQEAGERGVLLVDLERMDTDLGSPAATARARP